MPTRFAGAQGVTPREPVRDFSIRPVANRQEAVTGDRTRLGRLPGCSRVWPAAAGDGRKRGEGGTRHPTFASPLSPLPSPRLIPPALLGRHSVRLIVGGDRRLAAGPGDPALVGEQSAPFFVAGGLAAVTLAYYLLAHAQPVLAEKGSGPICAQQPPGRSGKLDLTPFPQDVAPQLPQTGEVIGNAVLGEYIPFITLLFTLYTICGGMRIEGDLPAHPLTNCAILAVGGVLASLIGTTGAAMLLIRSLLETNRERKRVHHTVIFFIFIVCNCGGCLLPLGDPPLLLGYLHGRPLPLDAYALERVAVCERATAGDLLCLGPVLVLSARIRLPTLPATKRGSIACGWRGFGPTRCCWCGVVLSVALLDPGKALPGTDWHPWMYLREAVQLGAGRPVACDRAGPSAAGQRVPTMRPIVEVAVLFFGIFVCMQPAAGNSRASKVRGWD